MQTFLSIFLWLSFLAAIIGFVLVAIWLLNEGFVKSKTDQGVVVGKYHKPFYSKIIVAPSGDIMVSSAHRFDYGLNIKVGDKEDVFCVSAKSYKRIQVGETVTVKYKIGRLSKRMHIIAMSIV